MFHQIVGPDVLVKHELAAGFPDGSLAPVALLALDEPRVLQAVRVQSGGEKYPIFPLT